MAATKEEAEERFAGPGEGDDDSLPSITPLSSSPGSPRLADSNPGLSRRQRKNRKRKMEFGLVSPAGECNVIAAARSHLKFGSVDKAQSQYILPSSQEETSGFGATHRRHSGPD